MAKKNDWLAVLLNQPEWDIAELQRNDITPDNTELKSREYYKNVPQIIDTFTKDGKFDETGFDAYYKSTLNAYNTYANNEFEKVVADNYLYDPDAWWRPVDSNVRDRSPYFVVSKNNDTRAMGISSLGRIDNNGFSIRELAEREKVVDPTTGEELDWSPNEKGGLFKGLFRPTVVLATWDEDGEHIFEGRTVKHYKGDYKLNSRNKFHYELLGDREIYDKDVLHYTDTITVDGSRWNDYDFMDNDGLDKSLGGTVMKTVFTVAPMLIPKVGKFFGAISAGAALNQVIPTIGKSINGIISGDNNNNIGKSLTAWESWSSKFGTSVSDYSRDHLVSSENLGNLVSSISLQLFEQRVIGNIPRWIKAGKHTAMDTKVGQNLALAYMAATSSRDTYAAFKAAGADDRTAGLGMIASMGAMYTLMNQNYFRDMLFRGDHFLDENFTKVAGKNLAAHIGKMSMGETVEAAAKATAGMQKTAVKEFVSLLGSRSINEAVEETAEELSQDVIKALFQGLSALGIPMNYDKAVIDFGWSASDMLQRYGMSFFGGAIGGPIFELQGTWEKKLAGQVLNRSNRTDVEKMVYYIAQGRGDEIRDMYGKWHKKGKLGSTNLSGTKLEEISTEEGIDFIAEADDTNTQNDVVYNTLLSYVDYIEGILSSEGLLRSKAAQEADLKALLQKKNPDFADIFTEVITRAGLHTSMFSEFNSLSTDIVLKISELEETMRKMETSNASTEDERKTQAQITSSSLQIQKLQNELTDLRNRRQLIIDGERNDYYIGQSLYALAPDVNKLIFDISIENFARVHKGVDYSALTEDQKAKMNEEYAEYVDNEGKISGLRAFDIYFNISERLAPRLMELNTELQDVKINDVYQKQMLGIQVRLLLDAMSKLKNEISTLEAITDRTLEQEEELRNKQIKYTELALEWDQKRQDPSLALIEQGSLFITPVSSNHLGTSQDAVWNYAHEIEQQLLYLQQNNIAIKNDDELNLLISFLRSGYSRQSFDTKLSSVINKYAPLIEPDEELLEMGIEEAPSRSVATNDGKDLFQQDGQNFTQSELYDIITKFVRSLDVDTTEAKDIYNEAVTYILNNSEGITEAEAQDIVESLLPDIATEEIVSDILPDGTVQENWKMESVLSYLNRINDIRKGLKKAAFIELLEEVLTDVNGTPLRIVDLLREEQTKLASSSTMYDYVIESTNVEQKLEMALNTAKMLLSIIGGSGNTLNEKINLYRSGEKIPFAILNETPSTILIKDAHTIIQKLDTLLQFSYGNKKNRLLAHRNIAANMHPKFIQGLFGKHSAIENTFNQDVLGSSLNPETQKPWTLQEIWESVLDEKTSQLLLDHIDTDNYWAFKEVSILFEAKLHKLLNSLYNLNDENKREHLAEKLVSLFSNNVWKMESTILDDNELNRVKEFDLLVYLATIAGISSDEFYPNLGTVVNTDTFKFAPLFSQEHAVKIGYSVIKNKDFFNRILTHLHNRIPEKIEGADESSMIYIKNKIKANNILHVFGGAGVGKTTAVGYMLKQILEKEGASIGGLVPGQEQKINLQNALDLSDTAVFTKEDFFEKALGKPITADDYEPFMVDGNDTSHIRLKNPELEYKNDPFLNKAKYKVIFIDESTFFNEPEYQALITIAEKYDIQIIAFGDLKQNSAIVEHKGIINTSGIEDTFYLKVPRLTASLRPNVIGKIENYTALDVPLSNVLDIYDANPWYSVNDLDEALIAQIDQYGIPLKWFEQNTAQGYEMAGEKFVESDSELVKHIGQLLGKEKLAIIVDEGKIGDSKKNRYNTTEYLKDIPVLRSSQIQGGEFDFVFIDKEWDKTKSDFLVFRDFYTLTQRSKTGSIIKNNGIINRLYLKPKYDKNAIIPAPLHTDEINAFKKDWLESLSKIHPTDIANSTAPASSSQPTEQVEMPTQRIRKREKPVVTEKDVITVNPEATTVQSNNVTEPENITINQNILEPEVQEQAQILNEESHSILLNDKEKEPSGVVTSNIELSERKIVPHQKKLAEMAKSKEKVVPVLNDDFISWMYVDNNLWGYDKQRDNSLFKFLQENIDPKNYAKAIRLVSNQILFGKDLSSIRSQFERLLKGKKLNSLTRQFEKEDYPEMFIVYDKTLNKSVLIARYIVGNEIIEIPIAFPKTNITGRYIGKPEYLRGPGFEKGPRVPVNYIQKNGQFKVADEYWVFIDTDSLNDVYKQHERGDITEGMYYFNKNVRGDANISFTDDITEEFLPFITSPVFDKNGKVIYYHQNTGKYKTAGIQRVITLSDAVINSFIAAKYFAYKGTAEEIKNALGRAGVYETAEQTILNMYNIPIKELANSDVIHKNSIAKLVPAILWASSQVDATTHNNIMLRLAKLLKTETVKNEITKKLEITLKTSTGEKTYLIAYDPISHKAIRNMRSKPIESYHIYEVINGIRTEDESVFVDTIKVDINNDPYPLSILLKQLREFNGMSVENIYNPEEITMTIVNFNNGKYQNWFINQVLSNLFVDVTDVRILDNFVSNHEYFKHNIFANDLKMKPLATDSKFWSIQGDKLGYTTDASYPHGSLFSIKESDIIPDDTVIEASSEIITESIDNTEVLTEVQKPKINVTSKYQQLIDDFKVKIENIKSLLSDNHISYTLPEFSYKGRTELYYNKQLETLISDINKQLTETTLDINIPFIDGESVKFNRNEEQFVKNLLKNQVADILNLTNNDVYLTFISDDKGYLIIKNKGQWELNEFLSYSSYFEAQSLLNTLTIEETGMSLQEIFKIKNYLSQRLINNEC